MADHAAASDPELLVLLALRLQGSAPADSVALGVRRSGGPESPDGVDIRLAQAVDAGLVVDRSKIPVGFTLTPAGRARLSGLLAEERSALPDDIVEQIREAYLRFRSLNQPMLACCTDWQLRDGAPNQHDDPAHDESVIDTLRQIDADVQPVCESLARCLQRFGGYGERFEAALGRVVGGELDYFTKPMIDSYHTIWFELHEHLLATLDIDRHSEAP